MDENRTLDVLKEAILPEKRGRAFYLNVNLPKRYGMITVSGRFKRRYIENIPRSGSRNKDRGI